MSHQSDDVQGARPRQETAASPADDAERGGDPACWLRRVCQQCGSMADADPPTTCPVCHAAMPVQ